MGLAKYRPRPRLDTLPSWPPLNPRGWVCATGMNDEVEVIVHEKQEPGQVTKLVANLQDLMRGGLRRRKASSSATPRGRVHGFKVPKEETQFSEAIEKACRELEDMIIGNRRAARTVTPSGMVVWREHDPAYTEAFSIYS